VYYFGIPYYLNRLLSTGSLSGSYSGRESGLLRYGVFCYTELVIRSFSEDRSCSGQEEYIIEYRRAFSPLPSTSPSLAHGPLSG
jgi:hypothetical protein